MPALPSPSSETTLHARFCAEVRAATRSSGAVLGAVGLVAMPAWSVVDHVLEPANAALFLQIRIACSAVMLAVWLVLLRTPLGERRPEALMLLFLVVPEVAIAFMLARLEEAHAIYATGLSLAIYGSAFLLVWHWRWPVLLVAVTTLALVVSAFAVQGELAPELAGAAFYLGTASALAVAGQWVRHRFAWREFLSRAALEREQARNAELLARLERLTHEDELTGLANRRSWDAALDREVARSRRSGAPLALLLCDIDHFKRVNDEHGHPAGDHVLRVTGARLAERSRATDLLARLGGDEFGVLCPATTRDEALVLARALLEHAAASPLPDGSAAPTTLSIGVAALEPGDARPQPLVARADRELYRAKRTRATVCAAPAPTHALMA